jgi:hypothetical protein
MQLRKLAISFSYVDWDVVQSLASILALLTTIQVTATWINILDRIAHQALLVSTPQQPVANIPGPRALAPGSYDFTLRHVFYHGTYQYPNLHRRLKIHAKNTPLPRDLGEEVDDVGTYRVQSFSLRIQRLADRRIEAIKSFSTAPHVHGIPHSLSLSLSLCMDHGRNTRPRC